ncbi:MAG: hypothetical protein MUO40_00780 [Anaerolineaceae bacterium]|nr:hypothetical protein [Anaerolineaceae bacterium]
MVLNCTASARRSAMLCPSTSASSTWDVLSLALANINVRTRTITTSRMITASKPSPASNSIVEPVIISPHG